MGHSLHEFAVGSQFEAQIAHDYLADNGIQCVVRCDEIPLQPGFTFGLEGWGSLLVTAQDAPKAQELLALIPGVGQVDGESSDKEQRVSGAFQIRLSSVWGVALLCLLWPIGWRIAVWYLLPLTGWGADNDQFETALDIAIVVSNLGGVPPIGLIIFLTNGQVLLRVLPRAGAALVAAFFLLVLSPIWLLIIVYHWSIPAFQWLRKRFEWLARLPEHLSD